MIGEVLVVERIDLDVTRRSVQADRLDERPVGLETDNIDASALGVLLELGEQTPAHTETAHRIGDPHPLDLCGPAAVALQGSAPDGLISEPGNEQETRRLGQLRHIGGDRARRIEPVLESIMELREIGPDAELGGSARRVLDVDADQPGRQQSLDFDTGFQEP